MLRSYKDLTAWQTAYQLALDVYRASGRFPERERYGLTAQLRRAAVSIPSNIAEGYGRRTRPDYLRSLHIAYGSVCELETQLLLATDLGYLTAESSKSLLQSAGDVERLLKALIRALDKED
jgi:four helix bundle protein